MKNLQKITAGVGILILLFLALPIHAQSLEANSCPQIVTAALNMTDEACSSTDRNEVCYGHALIEASVRTNAETGFTAAGDMVDLDDLRSIRLSPMDEQDGIWGVSLMRLQASLPDDAFDRNVTLVVFGDVALENAAEEVPLVDVTVSSFANLNIRLTPRIGAHVLATLASGETITVNGRLEDNSWLRVTIPQTGENGWINSSSIEPTPALNTLEVVENTSTYYRPMQAFYFQSGNNDSPCPEAPNSGLLIQTPEGAGKLRFLVNEVSIRLGSTLLLQTTPDSEMILSLLEGSATAEVMGVKQVLFPGTMVRIPLGPNNVPVGPPSPPEPYDGTQASVVPVSQLESSFEIVRPMTHAEINAQMMELYGVPPTPEGIGDAADDDGYPTGQSEDRSSDGDDDSSDDDSSDDDSPSDGGQPAPADHPESNDGPHPGEPPPPPDDGGGDDGGKDSGDDHDSGQGNDDDWVPPGQAKKDD